MKPKRVTIPKAIRDALLDEFNHKCAICGEHQPQIHHIDENPSNNSPTNLLPLCPNHHLRDRHDPTRPVEQEKLSLFRIFRDPGILDERFHPLWLRSRFIKDPVGSSLEELERKADELIDFVGVLQLGPFYREQLRPLVTAPGRGVYALGDDLAAIDRRRLSEYLAQLNANQDRALRLIVELIRYQGWQGPTRKPA